MMRLPRGFHSEGFPWWHGLWPRSPSRSSSFRYLSATCVTQVKCPEPGPKRCQGTTRRLTSLLNDCVSMPEACCECMKIVLRMELQKTSKTLPNHRVYMREPRFRTTWLNDISKWLRLHAGTLFLNTWELCWGERAKNIHKSSRLHAEQRFCKDYAGGVAFTLGNTSFFLVCRDFRGWVYIYTYKSYSICEGPAKGLEKWKEYWTTTIYIIYIQTHTYIHKYTRINKI